MQRVFLVPFLPLPHRPRSRSCCPWMWYLAFPARLVFVVGEPIECARTLRAAGAPIRPRRTTRRAARRGAASARACSASSTTSVARYGGTRYDVPRLVARPAARDARALARASAHGMAALLHPARARSRASARAQPAARAPARPRPASPSTCRSAGRCSRSRAPCAGRRGVTAACRAPSGRCATGRFVWRLAERPLPPRPDRRCHLAHAGRVTAGARSASRGARQLA